MLRKGALESGLGEIILTVLVAAVISGAMFGPLGSRIGEGFQEAEQFTDLTTQVTVSDSETLGDLAQYSFYRAWNCDKVEETTFKGLTSTNITDTGQLPCAGAGGTTASSVQNLYSNTGNDMEGKYSRVNFVVNETVTLKTGQGFGPDDGKSAVLLGVSTGEGTGKAGYSDYVRGSCSAYDPGVWRDWGGSWEEKGPPYSFQTLFFKNGGGTDRIVKHGNGATIEDIYSDRDKPKGLYCLPLPTQGSRLTKPVPETGFPDYSESLVTQSSSGVNYDSTGGNSVEVKLCPGDKGYVETRKGYPTSTGESTGNIGSTNNNNLYGMIQITQMNSSCSVDGPTNPLQPYEGKMSGSQLYIRSDAPGAGSPGPTYPNTHSFELRDIGNAEGTSPEDKDVVDATGDRCQIYMREKDVAELDIGQASYKEGVKIDASGQQISGLPGHEVQMSDTGDPGGDPNLYDIWELSGQEISSSGVLQKSFGGGDGENALYGDLLCANPDSQKEYAQWHVCYEGQQMTSLDIRGEYWSCDTESGEWTSTELSYPQTVTSDYSNYFPPNQESEVIAENEDGSYTFTPSESQDDDHIFYDGNIPSGDKTLIIRFEFSEAGHVRFDLNNQDSVENPATYNPPAYVETDSNKEVSKAIGNQDEETIREYELGKTHTLRFVREADSTRITWNGELLEEGLSRDWHKLQIESWNQFTPPEVEIKEVKIEK